jgi:hypothetical protein
MITQMTKLSGLLSQWLIFPPLPTATKVMDQKTEGACLVLVTGTMSLGGNDMGKCVADIGMESLESASLIPKIDYHSQLQVSYIRQ